MKNLAYRRIGQTAVFVDSGYLYAEGSVALFEKKKPRHELQIDAAATFSMIRRLHQSSAPETRLLRVYWYDCPLKPGYLSLDQQELADTPGIKLRLGRLKQGGEQKGVDALIVTDMIELARSQSITDVILISGDDDLRVGVEIAQSYGVRAHIAGIAPLKFSVSRDLLREADGLQVIEKKELESIIHAIEKSTNITYNDEDQVNDSGNTVDIRDSFNEATDSIFDRMAGLAEYKSKIKDFYNEMHSSGSIPYELDRAIFGKLKSLFNRNLTDDERKHVRNRLRSLLAQRADC